MNKIILVALVFALVTVAIARPNKPNRPNLFNRPHVDALVPKGSGTASGAGTASVNAAGLSVSGVAITSAQDGGTGHAVGHASAATNVETGEASGTAGGSGESSGK